MKTKTIDVPNQNPVMQNLPVPVSNYYVQNVAQSSGDFVPMQASPYEQAKYYMPPSMCFYPQNIQCAGVNLQQAQNLNFLFLRNQLEIEKKRQEKILDFEYSVAMKDLNKSESIISNAVMRNDSPQNKNNGIDTLIKDFMQKNLLVKRRNRLQKSNTEILIRNEELFRHVPIEEKNLRETFNEFLLDSFSIDADIPQKFFDRAWMRLKSNIPFIEKFTFDIVSPYQLVFLDGILDLNSTTFSPFDTQRCFFNDFSIPFNFSETMKPPFTDMLVFDKVLADMFNDNQEKIRLAYEFIGAILSSVPNLKKIYVLQGVSNGGKTRLAQIISRLLQKEDLIELDTLSDITQDYVHRQLKQCRLIYIDEAADKKIVSCQASALKTIANGCGNVKILISTNNALYTGNNGFLEPALLNRFAVLPFEDTMKNSDPQVSAFEDMYLERESIFIIKKALENFMNVLHNNMNFSIEFPINAVTCQNNSQISNPTYDELATILKNNYELVDYIVKETTTESVFRDCNSKTPSLVPNTAILGKIIKKVFGDKLKTQHLSNGMAYNLRVKK